MSEVGEKLRAGRLSTISPIVVFVAIAVLSIALVIVMFWYESGRQHKMARDSLRTILELKADAIELLLTQREGIARAYGNARSLRAGLTRLAQRPDPMSVSDIQQRIEELKRDLELDAVFMLDAGGRMVAGAGPQELLQLSPEFSARAARSMAIAEPTSNFLHHDAGPSGGLVLIDYITPIAGTTDRPETVGAIVLRENARGRLFHLIQDWPTPSPSAEALLVRRDGDDVLYLNDLRHAKDTSFRLRQRMSETGLPAVVAVLAKTPLLLEGTDYRGASVVAASRQIVGTDWFLITKVDSDEVHAPARKSAVIWLSAILCMTLLAAAGVGIVWRQQMHLTEARRRADITGREHAEAQLSETDERYRALFERSLDCVFLADFDGNFLDANRAALELLGYQRAEISSVNFRNMVSADQLTRALAALQDLVRTGKQASRQEYMLRRKDGGQVIVEIATVLVYSEGAPSAVLGIAHDVTARKQAQREAEFQSTMLSTVQQTSPDAILVVGGSGNIISYNRQFLELWSVPDNLARAGPDEPLLQAVVDRMQDPDAFLAKVRYLYEHKDETSHDELKLKDGRIIDRHSSPVVGPGKEYFGRVWYFRDITERKNAEETLRESENRFRAMVEQSISGFYLIQDGKFVYTNSRFCEIFGYASHQEIDGRSPMDLVAAKDRASVTENIERRLDGKVKSLSYTFTGLRKDGAEIEVGVHGSISVYDGRPAIMGLLQDISERKRAEDQIRRYVAQLEQAMQSTINVVATIGELRDPYTHGHERRVGEIAAAIATEMGLDQNQVDGIRIAGYLHDVGKIAVPAEILAKPTKLSKAEFDLVKDHAQQSYEILKTVQFPWPVAEAAWQHHERMDGSGYPQGLKGEQIIQEARILSVADVVEAMSSHRPYRPGLGIEKALAEVEKNRGKLYCPDAADACLRLFREKAYQLPA